MPNSISTNAPLPRNAYPVAVSLFGTFRLLINGEAVDSFRSNKTRALLAYLLIEGQQPLLRTTLAELLWPDYMETSARTNLRQTLSDLRNLLAPFDLIQADRNYVQVRRDAALLWCDAYHFDKLITDWQEHHDLRTAPCPRCREELAEAVALATDPFLANFPHVESAPFQAWLQNRQAYFAARRAEAQVVLARTKARPGYLPPALTSFIGRVHELTELVGKLHHPTYRCLTLVGPGGIGKSRLARMLGEKVEAAFAGGVWWVELSGLAPTTPAEAPEQLHDRLATAIAKVLGLTFYGMTRPAEQVANYLVDQTALLILDSFEHLTPAAAWLPTLLTAAPHLHLLVTTRHRLPLQSQLVYSVVGLSVPPDESLDADSTAHLLSQYAGLQLFIERTESAQLLLSWDKATLACVNQLCRFVEGSPWAIEVAVSMLDRYTPAALLAVLQGNYRALSSTLLDLPARQRSAEAVFRTAWTLLTHEEAQTLACCSVFRGGFTLNAAQTVAAATSATLEALVQKSLLSHSNSQRYAMHDLVRQFAGEQLAENEALAHQSHAAHAAYFTALLTTWRPIAEIVKRFRATITQDWENVQTAWAWAVEIGDVALLQEGMDGLTEYYNLMSLFLEADAVFGRAVDRVRQLLNDTSTVAVTRTLQSVLAHLLWRHCCFVNDAQGDIVRAQPLVEELLTQAQVLEDGALIARSYCERAIIDFYQGDIERMERLVSQALPLAQQYGAVYDQLQCLNILATGRDLQGDYAAAMRYYQQALLLVHQEEYGLYEFVLLANIATIHMRTGHFTAAITYTQQALASAEQFAFTTKSPAVKANLGMVAFLAGDYTGARPILLETYQSAADLHDHATTATVASILGALYEELGEDGTALDTCHQVLGLTGGHHYTPRYNALCTLGHLYRRQGQWDAATAVYQQALTLSQEVNRAPEVLLCQTYLAAVSLGRGETTAALAAVEPLLANFATTPFESEHRPQALLLIAYQILHANHDPRAATVLQQAWSYVQEQAAKIDDPHQRATFLRNVPVNREVERLFSS